MVQRQRDPAKLEGDELQKWYRQSTSDREMEQRAAADKRRSAFFSGASKARGSAPSRQAANADPGMERLARSAPRSPVDIAEEAFQDFQNGPRIQRPNLAQSFIPVVGPAWEAAADLQDGNYGGAAFNAAMALGDALPVGAVVKGARAARKGIGVLKKGSVTAGAAAKKIKRAGLTAPGQEIHHSIPLNGLSRSAQDWRNHYALLKILPKATHRRLTGRWGDAPRFNALERLWHGTTDWQKSGPAALGAYAADSWENLAGPFDPTLQQRR